MDDLRTWLARAEEISQIRDVHHADWNKEIGAVAEVAPRFDTRAIVFDEIKDYPKGYRILTNCMLNASTLALTLGLETGLSINDLVSSIEENLPMWENRMASMNPKEVQDGVVMENVNVDADIDLLKFPSPHWHEHDGGRYIGTGSAVVLKDPETNHINVGTYRVMVQGKDTLGIHMSDPHHGKVIFDKYRAKGLPCPIVISFGHHPIMLLLGGSPIPLGVSEYNYLGGIFGEPLDVIIGKVTGLPYPSNSEIVVEGEISATELEDEGPFGEFLGYYASGREPRPLIKVKAVYYRTDPVILGAPPLKPPGGNSFWGCAMQSALLQSQLRKTGVPDAKVWIEPSGRTLAVISIKQRYPGHSSQAGHIALMSGGVTKYAIVVDDDIDPSNLNEVIWALCTRTDPVRSIDFVKKAVSTALDPLIRKPTQDYFSSRAFIDACKPFEWIKDFPRAVGISPENRKQIIEKWFKEPQNNIT